MSDVFFKCPHCGQSFVCDESYVGQEAVCTACQKKIMIFKPQIKSVRNKNECNVLVENQDNLQTDRCPYCAEEVSILASVCPHCSCNIFRCPQCGARDTMEFHEFTKNTVKDLGGRLFYSIAGGLAFGTIGAVIGWAAGGEKLSGYLQCKCCGHIIK